LTSKNVFTIKTNSREKPPASLISLKKCLQLEDRSSSIKRKNGQFEKYITLTLAQKMFLITLHQYRGSAIRQAMHDPSAIFHNGFYVITQCE